MACPGIPHRPRAIQQQRPLTPPVTTLIHTTWQKSVVVGALFGVVEGCGCCLRDFLGLLGR